MQGRWRVAWPALAAAQMPAPAPVDGFETTSYRVAGR